MRTATDPEEDRIKLVKSMHVVCGTEGPNQARMTLNVEGEEHSTEQTGDGPVDAAFNCVKALVPHEARLQLYQVHAVTEGTDAQATVSVRMEEDGAHRDRPIRGHRHRRRLRPRLYPRAEPPAGAPRQRWHGHQDGQLQGRGLTLLVRTALLTEATSCLCRLAANGAGKGAQDDKPDLFRCLTAIRGDVRQLPRDLLLGTCTPEIRPCAETGFPALLNNR